MVNQYIPDVGDIVWLDFDPQAGHEQAGHRPAVVLSPKSYNKLGLMICCPVTTKIKGYPFEVSISGSVANVALSDQVKSLDWRSRNAQFKGRISEDELEDIREKIAILLGV